MNKDISLNTRDKAIELATLRPGHLSAYFDISNTCNLKCRICYTHKVSGYNKPFFMTPETFQEILDSIHHYTHRVALSCRFESTISPYFVDILKIVSKYDFPEVNLTTNGSLIKSRHTDAIIECGVSWIQFSVHGASKQTYEDVHQGGSLDQVLRNIESLAARKQILKSSTPELILSVVLMKSNIHEIEEFVSLAANIGVDAISFQHLVLFDEIDIEHESLKYHKQEANYWIERALDKAQTLGVFIKNCPEFFKIDGKVPRHVSNDSGVDSRKCIENTNHHSLPEQDAPFGRIDRPNETVFHSSSAIMFSGWSLSSTGVDKVELKRDPVSSDTTNSIGEDGLVYIGDATFQNFTRPVVAETFPDHPMNYRAGWTFKLTRNLLPENNNEFNIHAVACNMNGIKNNIGSRLIKYDDINAAPYLYCEFPFNSIYIEPDGSVFPFPDCYTHDPFGTIHGTTFEKVWFGEPLMNLRERIINRNPPEFCKICREWRLVKNKISYR